MERRVKYLFTLCFIMGLQIHIPVTMFPADVIVDVTRTESVGTEDNKVESSYVPVVHEGNSNKQLKHQRVIINEPLVLEDVQPTLQGGKHEFAAGAKGSESVLLNGVNRNFNQASLEDLRQFNSGIKLNGLERDFSTSFIKSEKSEINRLTEDLRSSKLERLSEKLANLSSNLLTRKNILPSNKGHVAVVPREINKDGTDKYNNNTAIKSRQSSRTQTFGDLIINDKVHDTEGNNELDKISWPSGIVEKCPRGFRIEEHLKWKKKVRHLDVLKIETGCGSMQNRLITFNDSTKACIRYRMNTDQIQGDIFSYYLGKLLGMEYIPPSTLHNIDHSGQWDRVKEGLISAKWSENKPFIVTKWVESLKSVYMPAIMKDFKSKLQRENYQLDGKALGDVCDLMQWSDLIVFDYISANLDRVVNNLFNLKWNHKMLEKPIHNLEKSSETKQYVFIDNESGLFHGYRLLDSYDTYHESLLEQICIFRPSTIQAVKELYMKGSAGEMLQEIFMENEELHSYLPRMPQKNKDILQQRIEHVFKHMQKCQHAI